MRLIILEISMNLIQTNEVENKTKQLSFREIEKNISSAFNDILGKATVCKINKIEVKLLTEIEKKN
jgi:hypothetical protein